MNRPRIPRALRLDRRGEALDRSMTPAGLRRALPRTYHAFFARHGKPRRIQLESAAPIMAGRDALLLAPAASGKTEAFCAPLFERLLAERWPAPAVLIVSPTRALANDLCRRLRGPADALGIPLGRWTGERKEPRAGALPAVTILTPESLDARLSRSPAALRSVRAAAIDELHVLDGNPRGDQLRVLASRLRQLAGGVQFVAASATVADPGGLARRYLREAVVVRDPSRLAIRARIVAGAAPDIVGREVERLARAGWRKFLLFANRRDAAESYAAALERLAPLRGRVYVHHGSLSQRSRESVEEGFLAAPRALCVATMTLELGIDIGDVDLVGLLEPPADVAGLLQRIGRSGRRGQGPRAVLFARGAGDAFRYRTLLSLAREGDLAADPPRFHPSVLLQQALSLLHQNPGSWIAARAVARRLDPDLAAEWTRERIEGLLAHLVGEGWLEAAGGGRYVAGAESELRWRRGTLHSNLSDPRELEVFDAMTGEKVGSIAPAEGEAPRRRLRIAGRGRRIVWAGEGRVVVRDDRGGEAPRFAPRGVAVVSRRLARACARRLGIGEDEWPVLPAGKGTLLFHFLGTAGGEVLAAALERDAGPEGPRVAAAGPFALVLAGPGLPRVPGLDAREIQAACRGRRARLERLLGMGPYHRLLPPEERDRAVFEAADVAGLAEAFARARLCEPPPSAGRDVLEDLAAAGAGPGPRR